MENILHLNKLIVLVMDIFSFGVHFTDEKSCRLHFKEQRDKEGVVYNRCGSTEHY